MLQAMFNTLATKKICLLGFAFKANTGDTRESPGIVIAKMLAEENAEIVISDPKALVNAEKDLKGLRVSFEEDPYKAAAGCDAIAIVTEWELYKDLDYGKIFAKMSQPAFIFDGRNILDHQALFDLGFNVFPIGKPAMTHFCKE
jgi:UDPglucose 6-dehydrogenase